MIFMTSPQKAEAPANAAQSLTGAKFSDYLGLLPLIFGLAIMRSGTIAGNYGSYRYTDVNFIADGSNLIALSLVVFPIIILALQRTKLQDKISLALMVASIALQSASLFGLALLSFTSTPPGFLVLFCSIAQIVSVTGSMLFWTRQTLGCNTAIAVIVAFSALLISEPLILVSTYLDETQAFMLAALGVLLQYPCLWACRRSRLAAPLHAMQSIQGFSMERKVLGSGPILAVVFIAFALTGLCLGFLRGYPAGEAIPFTDTTRFIQTLITMCVEAAIVIIALHSQSWKLIAIMWASLQTLIALSLVSFGVFPETLAIGAIFVTTANAFMTAFSYYLYSLFMNCFDELDPYVYAFPIRVTWLSARAFSRIFLLSLPIISNNTILISSLVGFAILVATQIIFMAFLSGLKYEELKFLTNGTYEKDSYEREEKSSDIALPSAASRLPIRRGVRKMGEQFLLTEREMDVLILFAMGHKQQYVASELYISPGTVHAHIKRIYKKTGFHSRQNVLDYIKQYVEPDEHESG
jgi:DNA-binding CsgD family transcriptional regulator